MLDDDWVRPPARSAPSSIPSLPSPCPRSPISAPSSTLQGLKSMELDDAEENRRRRTYVVHRMRRGEMESAETRYGYLANQVKGWDNEFERLQEFTGMDQKFEPGAQGIVDEITERFKEKSAPTPRSSATSTSSKPRSARSNRRRASTV